MTGILLVADLRLDGSLNPSTYELVAAAHRMLGSTTSRGAEEIAVNNGIAVWLPSDATDAISELHGVGVDQILTSTVPRLLEDYQSGVYDIITDVVNEVSRKMDCETVLFADSDMGRVVAPRVAARAGGAYAADCIDMTATADSGIAVTRPVHGGNALAVYEFEGCTKRFITVRSGAFQPDYEPVERAPEIIELEVDSDAIAPRGATLVKTVSEEVEGVPLESADIVVAGGRGLGGPEPFDELRSLCKTLDAALGASRAACDAGWLDHSHQVGLTGKKISPKTYITVGISGASQHMAGCSSARNIVAINRDPAANIFAHSRFGVVGDWSKVLPAFMAACADLRHSD